MADTGRLELDVRRGMRVLLAFGMVLIVLALFPLARDPTQVKDLVAAWTVLLVGILFCVGAWIGQTPMRRPSLFTGVVLGFWAVNLVSALLSDYPANSLNEMRTWTVMLLLYLFAAHAFREPEEFWPFASAVCVALTLSSLYGFCQKFGYDPFPWAVRNIEEYRDLPATFGNPNFAGHMLGLVIPLAIFMGFKPARGGLACGSKYRWCLVLACVMLVHLYFTRIRGTVLGLAGAVVLIGVAYAVHRATKRTGTRPLIVTLILVAVLGAAGMTGISFYSKARTGSYLPLDGSLLLRYQGYFGACKMIGDRPLLGWGTENYRLENPSYWTPYEQHWFAIEHKMNFHVHNDYLEAGVDAGIPGAALYIAFLICGIVYGLAMFFHAAETDRRRLGLVLAACFLIFAIDGLFGFNVRVPVSRSFIFLLAGALDGTMNIRRAKPWLARPTAWAAALFMLAAVCAVVEARVFIGQYLYQQAQGAKHSNRPDISYDCLERGGRLIPWSSQFPRELGLVDMTRGQPLRAIPHFEAALQRNPCEVQSMVWLGRAYLSRASFIQMKTKPSELNPADVLKGIDQALDASKRALSLCCESSEAHELAARAYRVRGDWLTRTDPKSPDISAASREIVQHGNAALFFGYEKRGDIQRLIAGAYQQLGELDEAQVAYRLAVEALIGDERIWQLFFEFAQENKRYPAFLGAAEWAMERLGTVNDARASVLASLAIWSAQAYVVTEKEIDRAQRMIERAVVWAPNRLDVWNAVAATTALNDRNVRIRARLEKARNDLKAAGKPELSAPLQAVLRIWETNGAALPEASKAIANACQERLKSVLPQGLALEFGWMADVCTSALDTANLQVQDRAATLMNVGQIFMLMGTWEHAENVYALALPALQKDQRANGLLKHAEALGWMEKWPEAFAQVRAAIKQAPRNFNIQLDAARMLVRGGNMDEAAKLYAMLLEWPGLDDTSRRSLKKEADSMREDAAEQLGKEAPR